MKNTKNESIRAAVASRLLRTSHWIFLAVGLSLMAASFLVFQNYIGVAALFAGMGSALIVLLWLPAVMAESPTK